MNSLSLWIAAVVVTAAPGFAGEAKNDFDPDVDFSRFHTFSFIGGKDIGRSGWLDEPEMRERFKNFISGALEARGLKEVPKDANYSLAVRYWVARRQKQDVTVIDYMNPMAWGGYPPYWTGIWDYSYEEYVVNNYVDGTLVIDLIDPATKELVWRTFLRQKIEDRDKAYREAKKNLMKAMSVLPPSADEKEKMRQVRAKLDAKYH
ncbi:MAG TPA: DUF4136 domain-containing protein [Bryobacteraceae bacterium]|nr:DUF4136 domain-containing protein [Bryobacteraceae bacterium]